MSEAKPFGISKRAVWEAYKRVKANQGAAGVDGQSIEDFEKSLSSNLYKVWNRMASGCYFPPPVRRVEIPKKQGGGTRPLGIPTVSDRVAQMVAKMYLEPLLEPHFHPDSYAYRPNRSALDAVGTAGERCRWYAWVLDLDIKGFFDNLDHELILRALRKHTDCQWLLLYVERWLKAQVQLPDGTLCSRDRGTPQGGVISPLLANLFLHYAFDIWMRRTQPDVVFERYADDIVAHCRTEKRAQSLLRSVAERLAQCKLELHPDKTKIVFCKRAGRVGSYPHENFDFLGYTFRARRARRPNGETYISFLPAVSNRACKAMRATMRKWRLHRRTDKSLDDLGRMFNRVLIGWINYYGEFRRSVLRQVFKTLNRTLVRWAMRKYKKLRERQRRATHWLGRIARKEPRLFAHWQLLKVLPPAG
ncbi:MAG: group II intron reverse transcriptase/maturase [Acetobacteraceae bacterium]|nr:group II intron reverse transcriptase/maturase [Acetobacteraceae bacterium]